MKRRNIAFSGFMAAILLGAGAANAATTQIASRQYVDAAVDEIQTDIDALDTVVNDPESGLAAQVQGAVEKADAASSAVEQLGTDVAALDTELDSKLDSATADGKYEVLTNKATEINVGNQSSPSAYPSVGAIVQWTNQKIADLSDTGLPVNPGNINDNSIAGSKLENGAVTTDKIANDAVNGDKIADDSIGAEHIADGAVGSDAIADGSVTGADIANGTISADKLDAALNAEIDGKEDKINKATTIDSTNQASTDAYPSVKAVYDWTTAQIANVEFDPSTDLGAGSVSGDKIADGTITGDKIADNAVGTNQIADGAVGNADLAADSVTTDKIKDGTISTADLDAALNTEIDGKEDKANKATAINAENQTSGTSYPSVGAIVQWTNQKIADLSDTGLPVNPDNINDNSIAGSKLENGAVTTDKIADGAVTADKLDSALNAEIDGKQDKNMGAGHESHIVTTDETGTITSVAAIEQAQVTGLTDALAGKADAGDVTTINETIDQIEQNITNITAADTGLLAKKEDSANKTKTITDENKSSETLFPTIGAITQWTNTEIQKIRDEGIDIGTDDIGEGAVQTVNLANSAVTTEKIADNAVTSDKLSDDVVETINGKADANNVYTKTETDSKILEVALRRPVNTCTGASLCVLSITPENGLAWVNVTDPVGELPGPTVDLDAPSDGGQ